MSKSGERLWSRFRWVMWGGAAFLLLLPLLTEAPWTHLDYVLAAFVLGLAGGIVELAMWRSSDGAFRLASVVAAGAGLMLVWVNLAVGLLGSEDNPANLLFLGVLAVAIGGAIAARGNPGDMSRAMWVAAAAQLLAGAVGYFGGFASPGSQGVYEAAMGTALFCALWSGAALLYRISAARQRPAQ